MSGLLHTFDVRSLDRWMLEHVNGYAGQLSVEQFQGGQSNPTYKLITPATSYVMRRRPPGKLLKGAHAVEREARVLAALETTGVPVARVLATCADDNVIGTGFYVMEYVEGRIFRDGALKELSAGERFACYDALNAAIAQLHRVDYAAAGLADFGVAGNYVERQIARWTRQYLADSSEAGRDSNLDRLIDWLPSHVPTADETAIVHGDYRLENVIFHPREPRIAAVLDWELSTLGHPVADFAYHLMAWRFPAILLSGLQDIDLRALNIPCESEYVAAYCRRTGRDAIEDLDFYVAFNMFRFAAIVHGIKARVARGTAASDQAQQLVALLPLAAEIAWRQARNSG